MSRKNVFYDFCSSYLVKQLWGALRANWNIPSEDEYFLNLFLPLDKRKNFGYNLESSVSRSWYFLKARQTSFKCSTIAEIEAKAGVSIPAVSRVLNNRPDVIPGTRERVEQVIKESRCIRRREVNGLRKENNSIIDVLVTDLLSAT